MKDNFSGQAALYAQYRPSYPAELFDFIFNYIKDRQYAWDCATGNGQTAIELAKVFNKVYATDISQKQLDHSIASSSIIYSLQPAEKTNFSDNTFDLITVSQALHWFKFDEFYPEVKRVSKNGGWIAVWMYALLNISPEIDQLVSHHHFEVLKDYWDAERKYVDENYKTIPFPFEEMTCPEFFIEYKWTLKELEGYLNTWSALQKFVQKNHYNPVKDIVAQIKPYWISEKRIVRFPLHLRMGKITK